MVILNENSPKEFVAGGGVVSPVAFPLSEEQTDEVPPEWQTSMSHF